MTGELRLERLRGEPERVVPVFLEERLSKFLLRRGARFDRAHALAELGLAPEGESS